MKKFLPIIFTFAILLCVVFSGCNGDSSQEKGSTPVSTNGTISSTVESTTASSRDAVYIYDGTGEKQGKKLCTITWDDKDKIETINNILHTEGVLTSQEKEKEDVSSADKIYFFELVNKGDRNNYFYVYYLNDKVYVYSDDFSNITVTCNGYADVKQKDVDKLIK